mmetsp:Transcript_95989/g.240585  ORF Transcript_95989/g.240585 Transcript_95989/m.240585 type:complete len:330 (+) Transcript_95989:826-1815(+)
MRFSAAATSPAEALASASAASHRSTRASLAAFSSASEARALANAAESSSISFLNISASSLAAAAASSLLPASSSQRCCAAKTSCCKATSSSRNDLVIMSPRFPHKSSRSAEPEASTSTSSWFTRASTSTRIARDANSKVLIVSAALSAAELRQTRRAVLQFPPTEPSKIRVSLLSRNGTCARLAAKALTTLPNTSKLLLMETASFNWAPSTWLFFTRSEPARSTTLRRARVHATRRGSSSPAPLPPSASPATEPDGVTRGRRVIDIWKTAWLRLEALLSLVSAYTKFDRALRKASSMHSGRWHFTHVRPGTAPPFWTVSPKPSPASRSR